MMSMKRISSLLLAVAVTISASALLRAESTSIQWGDETSDVSVGRSLQWKKPKTASSTSKVASNSTENPIQQVQFQQPAGPPPSRPMGPPTSPPMSPSQLDLIFPEKRPQSITPPEGATTEITAPSNPPSSFGPPVPTTEPKTTTPEKTAPPTSSTTSKSTTPTSTIQTPKTELDAPKSGTKPAPKPEIDPITTLPLPSLKGSKEIACPDSAAFKSIRDISYDIRPMPGELPKECPLKATPFNGRYFGRTCYLWQASCLATKGAYFEDVQLERYGHTICPVFEPVISTVRFFVTIPILPYKMGLTPPNECVYTLGHYRVGNCAPYMLDPLPISVRAVLFEAAAIGGAVAIIP